MLTVDEVEVEVEFDIIRLDGDSASKAGIGLFKIMKLPVDSAKISPGINVAGCQFSYAQVMGAFAAIVMILATIVIGLGPEAHRVAFSRDRT